MTASRRWTAISPGSLEKLQTGDKIRIRITEEDLPWRDRWLQAIASPMIVGSASSPRVFITATNGYGENYGTDMWTLVDIGGGWEFIVIADYSKPIIRSEPYFTEKEQNIADLII